MLNKAVPLPMKPQVWWGVFNFGRLIDVHYRRRDAYAWIDTNCGKDKRHYFTVEKVVISKYANSL